MDKPTTHNHWKTILFAQGRSIKWLANQTGWNVRTVYAYSSGQLTPTREFLAAASVALGQEVQG